MVLVYDSIRLQFEDTKVVHPRVSVFYFVYTYHLNLSIVVYSTTILILIIINGSSELAKMVFVYEEHIYAYYAYKLY